YNTLLRSYLTAGQSYPSASHAALSQIIGPEERLTGIMTQPNNILAVSYIAALKKLNSGITPVPVKRSGYAHDTCSGKNADETGPNEMFSAFEIRKFIREKASMTISDRKGRTLVPVGDTAFYTDSRLAASMPAAMMKHLDAMPYLMENNDFSGMLAEKLVAADDFTGWLDIDRDLSNRIKTLRHDYTGFDSFAEAVRTKRYTHARVRRALMHILCDITCEDIDELKARGHVPFIRLLGFGKGAEELVSSLYDNASVPVIGKGSDLNKLDGSARKLYDKTVLATDRFRLARQMKYHTDTKTNKKGLIIV
ncbi:MAG: nucleotidyltransferase family protein, partial [Lachnospiraceae bacterium]|nr:nucleotidyltransferase family protein [Lachnospiraceae bacterium]